MVVFLAKRQPKSINSGRHVRYEDNLKNDFDSAGCKSIASPDELYARIYYFHLEPTGLDVDNFSKPILDALKGKAYPNDDVVILRTSAKIKTSSTELEELSIKDINDDILRDLLNSWDTEKHIIYIEIGKFSKEMIIFGG